MDRYYVTVEIRAYVEADSETDAQIEAARIIAGDIGPDDCEWAGGDVVAVTKED